LTTPQRPRVTRHALIVLGALALAACAHAPSHPVTAESTAIVPAHAATPVEAATAPGTVPSPSASAVNAPAGGTSLAAAAAAIIGPVDPAAAATPVNPAQYGDLFDRMRAGFRLQDYSERHSVEQQLRWYAANPEYLQRSFDRADHYLYQIVTQLEQRGMPLELALLPLVESAFEPYAYSRASAAGLWQFIPGTGSRFGLKQDWWYDGRRDVVESTRAALDYLQYLHDEFDGDWLLAIAAYNCGEANVERAVRANRAAGRSIQFWDLKLPSETRAYVPKLLAMKELVAQPDLYGLDFSPIPNLPYFARVATDGQISMKVAAEIVGMSPEEMYELNPAFHRFATDPTGPYFLLVPVDVADVFSDNLLLLTDDQRTGIAHYTVQRGDSVASVAKHFNTTPDVIRQLNSVPSGPLTVGTDVRVPAALTELPAKVVLAAAHVDRPGRSTRHGHVQVVRRGESLWSIARRHGMNVNTLAAMNGMHPGDALRAGQHIKLTSADTSAPTHKARRMTYTVREGDTVAQIARLFQCSVPDLLAWNGMSSGTHLRAGQKLRIHLVSRPG
jgi:membrane-bound lytic murein transglycosylase D